MSISRNANDPGAPVRFLRYWRGYQKGQVARFDTATAAALLDRRYAIAYRPDKAEQEADKRRAEMRQAGLDQDLLARHAAIAARQGALPGTVTK
jgi:hypothetical protein